MSLYLDTSVIVSLFIPEARSPAIAAMIAEPGEVIVSDLAAGEFSAAISSAVRTRRLAPDSGRAVLERDDLTLNQSGIPMRGEV